MDKYGSGSKASIPAAPDWGRSRIHYHPRRRGQPGCRRVIVSTREIDASDQGAGLDASGGAVVRNQDELRVTSARCYKITIRRADRSSRVINLSSPASWRPWERVIVIDGANPSNR